MFLHFSFEELHAPSLPDTRKCISKPACDTSEINVSIFHKVNDSYTVSGDFLAKTEHLETGFPLDFSKKIESIVTSGVHTVIS